MFIIILLWSVHEDTRITNDSSIKMTFHYEKINSGFNINCIQTFYPKFPI